MNNKNMILLAIEAGYRACEKGDNLQQTLAKIEKLISPDEKIVISGKKGTITLTTEVDEDGFPVIDIDFGGSVGFVQVYSKGDPKVGTDINKGDQLMISVEEPEKCRFCKGDEKAVACECV